MTADEQTTGPVWRDRGTIIANQQARIAELEAERDEARAGVERLRGVAHGFVDEIADMQRRAEAAEADAERWKDKANEAGAAYANANTKHHAELDRANRLERLADTLAGRAVDLEDKARAAEADAAGLRARMLQLADEWAECRAGYGVPDPSWSYVEGRLRDLAAEPTPAAESHAEDGA